jgi:hypothetical protein
VYCRTVEIEEYIVEADNPEEAAARMNSWDEEFILTDGKHVNTADFQAVAVELNGKEVWKDTRISLGDNIRILISALGRWEQWEGDTIPVSEVKTLLTEILGGNNE